MNYIWQLGAFFIPEPFQEKNERPFFSLCVIIIDQKTNLMISNIITPLDKIQNLVYDSILEEIEKIGVHPKKIFCQNKNWMNFDKSYSEGIRYFDKG
jgi:hypothetical protein